MAAATGPPAQALGLGVRGPAARPRRARGDREGDPRAARLRDRRDRGARAAGPGGAARAAAEAAEAVRGDVLGGSLRPRRARDGQGLPRRRPRLPRPVREPARPGRLPRVGRGRRHRALVLPPTPAPRRSRSAAAPASSAGSSRGSAATTRGGQHRPAADGPRAGGRRGLARGADPGRGDGAGLEEQLREHGLTLRHFPQSFEYSTLGGWIATRAGGHFATLYTHIDDLVESVRAVTPAASTSGSSRRLPGSGAGPSPDRLLLGSEGILGVIVDAWMRVQERPRWKPSCGVAFDDFAAGAEAVREISPVRALPHATAGCSTPTSPRSPAPAARQGAAGARASSRRTIRSRSRCDRAGGRARHGGEPGEVRGGAEKREAEADAGRRLAQRLPLRPLPARLAGRLRRPLRHLRDRDHLGPLPRLPRRGDGGGAQGRGDGLRGRPPRARARRGSAAASPTSIPTGPRPTTRCWPRPGAAPRSSSGTRSRRPSPRR